MFDTVGELKAELDNYADEMPLRVAQQPSWPLRAKVVGVVPLATDRSDDDDTTDADAKVDADADEVLWIATQEYTGYTESPYAPRAAWEGQ